MKMRALAAMIAFVAVGFFSASAFACGGKADKSSSDETTTTAQTEADSKEEASCACGQAKTACEKHKHAEKDDADKTS